MNSIEERYQFLRNELISISKQLEYKGFSKNQVRYVLEKNRGFVKSYATLRAIFADRYNSGKNKIRVCEEFLRFFYNSKEFGLGREVEEQMINIAHDKGLYYDVFYNRVDGSDKEVIGVAKLYISDDWKSAEMKYFYQSKFYPDLVLVGEVSDNEKGIISISFKDKIKENQSNKYSISNSFLYLSYNNKNENEIFIGTISTITPIKGRPLSSIVVLQKSNKDSIYESEYVTGFEYDNYSNRKITGVSNEIIYYLSNRQIKVEKGREILTSPRDLITSWDYERMVSFEGTFQSLYFSTNTSEKSLRSFIIKISKDGTLIIDKEHYNNSEKGRARIIYNDIRPIILLQFDYNSDNQTYRNSFMLKQSAKGYLEGVYMGLENGQIASGRVILKKVDEGTNPLGNIFLDEKDPIEKLKKITNNDDDIISFFQDDNIFGNYTDLGLKNLLNNSDSFKIKETTPIDEILIGNYLCYFNIKRIENSSNEKDSSTFGQALIIAPLCISKNDVEIKYYDEIIKGEITFDNKRILLTFKGNDYYITIQIRPLSQRKRNVIYGIITVTTEKNYRTDYDSIQSSYLIIERNEDENISFSFSEHDTLNDLVFIEKSKKRGLISKLWGHYNRTILVREPNADRYEYNHVRWEAYRRTFWNSACFNALQSQNETDPNKKEKYLSDAYNDLKRAHRHGFGMKYWSDKEYGQSDFPKALAEEYEMILKEYEEQKYFKDEKCRNYLKRRIDYKYDPYEISDELKKVIV